jgi:hypothetical protein
MSNIVNLFEKDLISCSYFEPEDGEMGLSMRDRSLMVLPLNKSEFEVILGDESKVYTRAEIAEFLKVAAIFVDSEGRYMPDMDLIGFEYT